MAFCWRVDDGPLIVVFGSFLPSLIKKKNIVKVGPPLTKLSGSAHAHCLWGFCVCFLFWYALLSALSSWWGIESWLLCFSCLLVVLWLIVFYGSSIRCCGFVCSVWYWYFLIILTYSSNSTVALRQIGLTFATSYVQRPHKFMLTFGVILTQS